MIRLFSMIALALVLTLTPITAHTLTSGVLWPMPITLDVTEAFAAELKTGDKVALRDLEGVILDPDRDAKGQDQSRSQGSV